MTPVEGAGSASRYAEAQQHGHEAADILCLSIGEEKFGLDTLQAAIGWADEYRWLERELFAATQYRRPELVALVPPWNVGGHRFDSQWEALSHRLDQTERLTRNSVTLLERSSRGYPDFEHFRAAVVARPYIDIGSQVQTSDRHDLERAWRESDDDRQRQPLRLLTGETDSAQIFEPETVERDLDRLFHWYRETGGE